MMIPPQNRGASKSTDLLSSQSFGAIAGQYERFRPKYPAAFIEAVTSQCRSHERAVDIGMGTGQLTLPLAERFHEVIGVDHDAKMVGALEGQIAKGNIKLQVARAEDLSLPSNSVDLITIGNALHWWFDSLPAFWNSVASSLKPGGVVVVCRHKKAEIGAPDTAIDEFLLEKFDRGVLAPFIPPASKHHAQALSEIPFPFTDLPATQRFYYPSESGSQAINKADLFGFLNTWSASKRFLDANGAPPTDAIAADLSALWPDGELKTIRWEIEYRIGVRK